VLPKYDWCYIAWAAIVSTLISASQVYSQEEKQSNYSPGIIHFYQEYISPIDGDRCPMHPSCSTYLKNCVKKHGSLKGWIIGLDRLVRCGRDEVENSPSVWINGKKHIYDPVKNNDFWWSEK